MIYYGKELYHHGILGQKWGIRRYQNPDGTLTEAGKRRYYKDLEKKAIKNYSKNKGIKRFFDYSTGKNFDKAEKDFLNYVKKDKEYKYLSEKAQKDEKERLKYQEYLHQKYDPYEENPYRIYNDKKYKELVSNSEYSLYEKNHRKEQLIYEYMDVIKDAKMKDLGITKKSEIDIAKKYINGLFNEDGIDRNIDGNLEFDEANYWYDLKKRY